MNKFIIIAGPCVAESFEMLEETALVLKKTCKKYPEIDFYFKASYKKANRTSLNSFTGVGDELALNWLQQIGQKHDLRIVTDIHSSEEAELAAKYVDVLQIPAFLARQTDLLIAAAKTGKQVNIKKAQFMAPEDMSRAAEKVLQTGNKKIWLTERGTCFGYHNLVVDFRGILLMKKTGFPVLYDATHSLQQPSLGEQSGGYPEFIPALARAAVAVGVDGVFFETHPNPKLAKSDSATQLELSQVPEFINMLMQYKKINSFE